MIIPLKDLPADSCSTSSDILCYFIINGYFDCSFNNLTTLEGGPEIVGFDYICYNNKLTSLQGAPKTIGGNFTCNGNQLTSLEGGPERVWGNYWCFNNKLTSLIGSPRLVGLNFWCQDNKNLISLENSPEIVRLSYVTNLNQPPTRNGKKTLYKKIIKPLGTSLMELINN
jgi:hypothetical protein